MSIRTCHWTRFLDVDGAGLLGPGPNGYVMTLLDEERFSYCFWLNMASSLSWVNMLIDLHTLCTFNLHIRLISPLKHTYTYLYTYLYTHTPDAFIPYHGQSKPLLASLTDRLSLPDK